MSRRRPAAPAAPRQVTPPVTGLGAGVAVAAVLSWVAGVVFGYPVLVWTGVAFVLALVVALLWVAARPQVEVSRTVTPDRVGVGEPALGRIDVRNRSRLPSVPFVVVDAVSVVGAERLRGDGATLLTDGRSALELPVAPLPPRGRRAVHYPVPSPRRGRVLLGPLTVERRDPLGLVRRSRRVAGDAVLWVHPRVHPTVPIPVGLVLDYEGRRTENARLGTVTFAALRDYAPGDDPRQIHWRSTARTGRLIMREHIDTTEPTTAVVLDTDAARLGPDAFEAAVEVTASVVRGVESIARDVVLRVVDEDPDVIAATGAVDVLDRLATAQRSGRAGRPGSGFVPVVQDLAGGGVLVVVTGDVDAAVLGRLAEQRRRFNPVVVVSLLDPVSGDRSLVGTRRRPGMTIVTARTAAEAVARWNRMASGEVE